MAPTNARKEALRLQEAKDAIKKMKQRRREGKKGDGPRLDPTVKALVAASVSRSKTATFPDDSLVTVRRKPIRDSLKKKAKKSKSPRNVDVKIEVSSPSPVSGRLNGMDQRPPRKSKKSSSSFSNVDTKSEPGLYDSPISTPNISLQEFSWNVPGMSTSTEDVHYSPYIKPSGVKKVYVNKKKAILESNKHTLPETKATPLHQRLISESINDENEAQPAVPKKRQKKSKKQPLKLNKQSIKIKKSSAPMSIKKTSASVRIPAFLATSDDVSSRTDLKNSQFYKNKKKGSMKSGFSVTTVSEVKLPLVDESSDDGESQVDDQLSSDDNEADRLPDEYEGDGVSPEGSESDNVSIHEIETDEVSADESEADMVLVDENDADDSVDCNCNESGDEYDNSKELLPTLHKYNSSGVQFHLLDGQVILHLEHPSTFTFCGQVQVKILKGAVEVLGYLLTPSNKYHTISSVHGWGMLQLQTVPLNENPTDISSDLGFSYSALALLKSGKPDDVFLLMKKSESILPFFVNQFSNSCMFLGIGDKVYGNRFIKASRKLQCIMDPPSDSHVIQKGEPWDLLSENIIESPGCTVLCGGQGVGKSTFLRFLVNRFLSNGSDQVLVIDFDPGQAELTVPGCVSITSIKSPFLGPNFTHLQNPLKCIYVGEIDVNNSVSRYMDACLAIISYWHSNEELREIPCVVNTMGFTRGIGVTIMVQLLSALQPSRVVQIMSSTPDLNYPEVLSVEYVKKSCSSTPFAINLDSTSHNQRHSLFHRGKLNFETHLIQSTRSSFGNPNKLTDKRQRRETVILAYLSQMVLPPNFSILDVPPYCCRLDTLYLHICHESVPPGATLSAFNASLVALCCVEPTEDDVVQLAGSGLPSIITKRIVADCLGFGIVRFIDMEARELYLLTPVPSDVLTSVNCLVLGAVNLPSSIYYSPPREPGNVPYVVQNLNQRSSKSNNKCVSFNK